MAPDASSPRICVGRDVELAAMQTQFESALAGHGSVCVVKGGIGAGKSTLLDEFARSIGGGPGEPVIAWGRCDPQIGSLRPLTPWADILESLAGVSDVASPGTASGQRDRVLKTARKAFVELAPDIVELLLPGAGLIFRSARFISKRTSLGKRLARGRYAQDAAPAAADRAQLEDQYVALIERVLDDSALVVAIDDLHCADAASLDLLQRLARSTADRRLLVVVATQDRPDDARLAATLDQVCGRLEATIVDLDQAMRERGGTLVAAYAQAVVPGVGERFVQRLTTHTGGLPLFVVELVEQLISSRRLTRSGDGTWHGDAAIDWRQLPRQVTSVLNAQFNALDEDVREVLKTASVEGDQFTVEIVAGVLEQSAMSVARTLSRRAPKSLVEPLGTFPIGTQRTTRFRFCHSLARQHAYESIDAVERTYLHEAVANCYEALLGNEPGAFAAQLAFHLDRAELKERARLRYIQAARFAESTGALTEAIAHLERAAIRYEPAPNAALWADLGRLYATVGRAADAAPLFERAIAAADPGAPATLAEMLIDQTHTLARLNRFDAAFDAATRALEVCSDPALRASAYDALANVVSKRGDYHRALEYQNMALAECAGLDDDELTSQLLFRHGWCLKELGRYDEARSSLDESLALVERDRPNWSRLAGTHHALADLDISLERYEAAREHLQHAVDAWRKFDQHVDMAIALNTLANVANREGLFEQALEYGWQTHALDVQLLGADHPDLAFALTCIGESNIGLGRYDAAIDALSQADALRTANEVPPGNRAWTRWLLGRALAESQRDPARGVALVRQARDALESMGTAAASELKDVANWLSARGVS